VINDPTLADLETEAEKLHADAASKPTGAMERLDVEMAKSELEE